MLRTVHGIATLVFVLAAVAWASEPNGAGLEPGLQVHEYNDNFYILRESGCINYEMPFLYLIFGDRKALLEDTGAGQLRTALRFEF
jgi:hypothetical protein